MIALLLLGVSLANVSFYGRLEPGERLVLILDEGIEISAPKHRLTGSAEAALAKAPAWLREDLEEAFLDLPSGYQEVYASLILSCRDPIVDEVTFQVAHMAPEDLMSLADRGFEELIIENAELVYLHDSLLKYVEVVDYGSSSDEDYYSTTRYKIIARGDTIRIEAPKEYYYWYVVHPVVLRYIRTQNTVGYIDPDTDEPTPPPDGAFWRDYLFGHADPGFPLLRDTISRCAVAWGGLSNVDSLENGALGMVSQWIQDVMDFYRKGWRPVQPVAIYHLHHGTCSEHAALTTAAARCALIPTVNVQAIANDHHWNEFWLGRWMQWEPVNTFVDNPYGYEGWGWKMAGVIAHRGDGYVWTVTGRYTPHASLTVEVLDADGRPVDGALVQLVAPYRYGGLSICAWQYTDLRGRCEFTVGDGLSYWATVDAGIGHVPTTEVISACEPGREYFRSFRLEGRVPSPDLEPCGRVQGGEREVEVRFEVTGSVLRGKHLLTGRTFKKRTSLGRVEFFLCDQVNYDRYLAGESFDAYEVMWGASGDLKFSVPDGKWYAVISNESSTSTVQRLKLEASYIGPTYAEEVPWTPGELSLSGNFPNPFNSRTKVGFFLPEPGEVEVSICDLTGRVVWKCRMEAEAGQHFLVWDGGEVASGVYICCVRFGGELRTTKMVLIR